MISPMNGPMAAMLLVLEKVSVSRNTRSASS
jgi:hypothetical protein